jgi:hypothetical protein
MAESACAQIADVLFLGMLAAATARVRRIG